LGCVFVPVSAAKLNCVYIMKYTEIPIPPPSFILDALVVSIKPSGTSPRSLGNKSAQSRIGLHSRPQRHFADCFPREWGEVRMGSRAGLEEGERKGSW
jgi:hypothetical protein